MEKNKSHVIMMNLFWRFAERCGAQIVTAVVSLLLARILMPEDYGKISLIWVFLNILNVFIDSGLGTALIQKKDADDLDFSSVFYFNFGVCLILYAAMFIAAPYIAVFYHDFSLTPVIRVVSLSLIFSGVKGIQQAYVSRNMLFKRFFFSTLGGTVFSAFLGLWMAYAGCGVWSLVAQSLSNTAIDTLILWLTVHWRPKKMFSWARLKGLLSYGWKLLVSSLMDTMYTNLRSLVIGHVYSSADLAYYNQGQNVPYTIAVNVDSSIDSVLLSAMSEVQDNRAQVKDMTRRAIKMSSYVIAPLMMAIAFCAKPLVRIFLTDKWLPCVPFMRIFCILYIFDPIHASNMNAIKALGRSDLYLKLEVIKKIVGMTILLASYRISVMALGYSLLLNDFIGQLINTWPNRKLLDYGYLDQLKDMLPGILLSVFMGGCMWLVSLVGFSDIVTLVIQIPLGLAVYLGGSALLKLDTFEYLWNVIKPKLLHKPWANGEE